MVNCKCFMPYIVPFSAKVPEKKVEGVFRFRNDMDCFAALTYFRHRPFS